jgi:hypothetical protein
MTKSIPIIASGVAGVTASEVYIAAEDGTEEIAVETGILVAH